MIEEKNYPPDSAPMEAEYSDADVENSPIKSLEDEELKRIEEGKRDGYVEWIKRSDKMFIPSTKVKVTKKVPAGLFSIRWAENIGYYLFKEDYRYDEILVLPTEDVNKVVAQIQDFWTKGDKFKEYGLAHKRGILLYGAAGNGKSSLINQIITNLIEKQDGIVLTIKSGGDLKSFASFMPEYFKVIEPERPVVTIIEDLDGLLEYNSENETLLLNILDGLEQMEKMVYIGTTNYPEKLKARILQRPSRFDIRLEIKSPTPDVRKFYFEKKLKPHDIKSVIHPKGHDIDEWVKESEGFTMAHLREMIVSIVVLGNSLEETIDRLRELAIIPHSTKFGKDSGSVGYKKSTSSGALYIGGGQG